VRIMNIHVGDLKSGQWRHLTAPELKGILPRGISGATPAAGPPK
jgi:hypothetical protein